MDEQTVYPADPMAAFYAAVTAVEGGQVSEVELEFRKETENYEVIMTLAVRREPRGIIVLPEVQKKQEQVEE